MKKLHITLIALFTLVVAQAQTAITENDLIGEWTIKAIEAQGNIIDLKTGEVVLSEETAEQLEASGEDVAEIKAAMVDGLKESGMADIKMIFTKGLKAEFHKGDSIKNLTYTLAQKDGANYIIRSDGKELRCKIEGGYLKLLPDGEDLGGVSLTFEKKK